ncbi:MAG: hypothetical protein C4582_06065 [Desulfobacteraceae bacterium]|jgi:acyl-CoA synthetase (NDP forming)|nr:MAG: hypothetical protein C4582_06065 [Desulfobacteraceae bacterium]
MGFFYNLEAVFKPSSVAVVGASPSFGKWGQLIMSNIVAGRFPGPVYPVNPGQEKIFGLKAYRSVTEIPGKVDLVFVATPARTVLSLMEECGDKGVKGVVLITSGFSETDNHGKKMELEVAETCRRRGIALIGPNTMGIIAPYADLFATGTHSRPGRGNVAFLSQSGNLGNQLIHWASQHGIGVSLFVGTGNEALISCTDLLEYLEKDSNSDIIILYLEGVEEGRRFLDVAARVNLKKPVIILKGGRTDAGRLAAQSHTGSMSGRDEIFRAVCRQAGLLNVRVPTELLDLSAGFSCLPFPRGNRVGIVTLGGGWGVVTSDECNERGLIVPPLPQEIVDAVGRHLPPYWSKGNPVDLVGTRDPKAPIAAVEELLRWDGVDAVISLGIIGRLEIVRLLVDSTRAADPEISEDFLKKVEEFSERYERDYVSSMVDLMERYEKPILGVTLAQTREGTVRTVQGNRYSGVFYQTPENAVNVLARMVEYQRRVGSLRTL